MRWLLLCALVWGCEGEDDDTAPPVVPPPAQVLVTVTASSTPSGAHVTGGGRALGTTPLQVQVPVPPPQPGRVQTFQFTFAMPNYEAQTVSASPVNNTITLNATLVPISRPVAQVVPPPPQPDQQTPIVPRPAVVEPPASAELTEADARRQIPRYYAARSEWAGQYVMRNIARMRLDRVAPDRVEAHTGYNYQCILPSCSGASDGYDARIFYFQRSGSSWRIVRMGDHMSARL
jgi:hypothetical protein